MSRLETVEEVVHAVGHAESLGDWLVQNQASGLVAAKRGSRIVLLAGPDKWGDEKTLAAMRESAKHPGCSLILLGALEEFSEVAPAIGQSLLPLPTSIPVLASALESTMGSEAQEVDELQLQLERARYESNMLVDIGRALSQERDTQRLLNLILLRAREVTGADAGSVYIVEGDAEGPEDHTIRFTESQNDSRTITSEGFTMPVSSTSIVGACVLASEVINIPDLYALDAPGTGNNTWGFVHDKSFDEKSNYQSRSLLTIPMVSARNQVIGVIQLINRRKPGVFRLDDFDSIEDSVLPFDEESINYATTLASQACIALENSLLYDEVKTLFEGFVHASVTAIESRDPTTSGHSERVADLTVGLAKVVDRADGGSYAGLRFEPDEIKQIEYAALLHDFGKVGVREHVLVKPKKLYGYESEAIDLREIATARPKSSTSTSLYAGLFDSDAALGTKSGANPLASLAEDVSNEALIEVVGFDGNDTVEDLDAPTQTRAGTDRSFEEESSDGEFDEDSVVSVSFATIGPNEDQVERRHDLLQEFLRIHETSLYEVLSLSTAASPREVEAAYERQSKTFSKTIFTAEELGRDYAKLDIVLATYEEARDTLISPAARKAYDESLKAAQQDLPNAPSMDAGIAFQEGEDLMVAGQLVEAIAKFKRAIQISPHEPDYHATLGWALFLHGGQDEHAADAARSHMNEALAIAPDSGLVHEYKGLVHAKLGDDQEAALQHLAKALDDDPRRGNALAAIESLHLARGEHRQLDKLYRRLLFHIGQHSGAEGAVLWRRMGDLHRHYLQEPEQALVAYREALKRSPDDAELKALCSELATGGRSAFYEATDQLVAAWKDLPADFGPISEIFQVAEQNDQFDTAFLASSALALAGQATDEQSEFYRRYRPRFVIRAQASVGREQWHELLHPEDDPLVGDLFGLLHEAIAELHPQKRAEEEVAQADLLSSGELSEHFRRMCQYLSNVLGVPAPIIYSRSDFGREIHVASLRTPVLLAGYEAVTCTDKLEVTFRLARAMSYLRPGRAIVAGCPSRVLKSAMMACYSLGSPHANVPDPDGSIAEFRDVIAQLHGETQSHALDLVGRLSRERPRLNLSRWTQIIPRTADRVGLLLCGDLGASMQCLGQPLGSAAAVELMSFAVSSDHAQLRSDMGLSIDV